MGYTHYMRDLKVNPVLAQAVREIVAESDCFIGNGFGEGEPVITDTEIILNGDASQMLDGETFYLAQSYDGFNFCKTNRKPYDEVVGAILICAICSGAEGYESISSDGTIEEIEWQKALNLYERCFGRLSEEEFDEVLHQIGRPIVYNEETSEWHDWDGKITRENYEEICDWLSAR